MFISLIDFITISSHHDFSTMRCDAIHLSSLFFQFEHEYEHECPPKKEEHHHHHQKQPQFPEHEQTIPPSFSRTPGNCEAHGG
jgi:hypothetical protein